MNLITELRPKIEFELSRKISNHDAYPIAESLCTILTSLSAIDQAEITGDLRRGKHSLNQIDLIAASRNLMLAVSQILSLAEFHRVIEKSETRLILQLHNEMHIQIWLVVPDQFASALLVSTGSNTHLENLNRAAAYQGKQITYNGILENSRLTGFQEESDIYAALGFPFIPPEVREGIGEIENAAVMDFTNLIQQSDIKADLHTHTNWSDAENSIEQMVCAALIRNLSVIAITDHSPSLLNQQYKDASYFYDQHIIIDQLREKYQSHISILKGVEVDILPNGDLDLPENLLKRMDLVIASLHVELDQPRDVITQRLISAIENPHVDIIGHPGGRLIPTHDYSDLDWERIFQAAAFNQVALEINSHKTQPVFDGLKVRQAVAVGVPITMNSDAHSAAMMDCLRYGMYIARRAYLRKNQVINSWSPNHLKLWLRRKRGFTSKAQ